MSVEVISMEYRVVYSNRKTLGLSVKSREVIIVRAPYKTSKKRIEKLIFDNRDWIARAVQRVAERDEKYQALDDDKIAELKKAAKEYFNDKIKIFADIMGLKYGRISITSAKVRFGSCNSLGNICFSYRLMLYPCEAREYVIVHELAHLVHMNHSRDFYALVEKYMPDYKSRKALRKI